MNLKRHLFLKCFFPPYFLKQNISQIVIVPIVYPCLYLYIPGNIFSLEINSTLFLSTEHYVETKPQVLVQKLAKLIHELMLSHISHVLNILSNVFF